MMLRIPTLEPRPLDNYDRLCADYASPNEQTASKARTQVIDYAGIHGMMIANQQAVLDDAYSHGLIVRKHRAWVAD